MDESFHSHIRILSDRYDRAFLKQDGLDGILIHSGVDRYYAADDQTVPFRSYGHFCHWLPVNRPDQFVLVRPDRRPVYFQIQPQDYWHEQRIDAAAWWQDEFDLVSLDNASRIGSHLNGGRLAYLGPEPGFGASLGIDKDRLNPAALLHHLDFERAYKTAYEVEQIRAANRLALQGHEAARCVFLDGGGEYDIHQAYLVACDILDQECPYPNIVALDDKAAILHYQNKRRRHDFPPDHRSQVLLIDAGCRVNAYCSDITRTSTTDAVHPVFGSLVAAMEQAELQLVGGVQSGLAYTELHRQAMRLLAGILLEHELATGTADELLAQGVPNLFMPHGVGHLLGIQVHDVGGHQRNTRGEVLPPPADFPFLRNTRIMAPGMVFTVEPGLYFIPMLLQPERHTARGRLLNWSLVDELTPLGGIRVEDNVLVTEAGAENLTRGQAAAS